MAYFRCGSGGSSVTIDGVVYEGDLKLKKRTMHKKLPSLSGTPYALYSFKGKLRALTKNGHYELNGEEWSRLGETVYCIGVSIINGYVYAIGSGSIYMLNNTSYTWTSKYNNGNQYWDRGNIATYNNVAYIGHARGYGSSTQRVYKYTGGTTITELCTEPYIDYVGKTVVESGTVYLLGTEKGCYSYSTSTSAWTKVNNGYTNLCSFAIVLNNVIHALGGDKDNGNSFRHDKVTDSTYTELGILPLVMDSSHGVATIHNGKIVISGGGSTSSSRSTNYSSEIYILDDEVYEIEE